MYGEKLIVTNDSTSIKKSNQLSAGKIMANLTLNQAQLFAYVILVTQKDGKATFNRTDFETQFNIEQYRSKYAKEDAKELFGLDIEIAEGNNKWKLRHVFKELDYDNGIFTYEWTEEFKPHILDLKERYTRIDLSVASKFKSNFTWILYEYLLAKYGYYTLEFTKEELLDFFNVSDKKGYISNTSNFKKRVLDLAISEINSHTEIKVKYDEIKRGRSIVGFKLYFNRGKQIKGATKKQVDYILDLLTKLKEDYIFKIIDINNAEQASKANNLIMSTLREVRRVDFDKLTHDKADELIKHLNSTIKLIETIISDDIDNLINKDKYADLQIPLYDWSND